MNPLSTRRTSSASPLTNTSSPVALSPVSNGSPAVPLSNSQIEAVIQMATSSANPAARDTRTQLFVGNLPYRVRWQDLKDLFRKAGTVLRADVSLGPDNRSRGYGTVLLATAEDAARAVEMFNGYNWQTRILEVRPDRLPPDFDNPNGKAFPSPLASQGFPSPIHPIYGTPLGDRALSFSGSEELDPTRVFGERMRTASNAGPRNLFVGNLPFHCQWQDLKDLFRQAGAILRADVALGPDGRSRGFGTVSFTNEIDAERALNMFNGYEFNGRILKVHYDKFSQGQLPQSPLPPNASTSSNSMLASPGPGQLHHSAAPTHIPMPMPPPMTAFEHMILASGQQSPYEYAVFGQISPYGEMYPGHLGGGGAVGGAVPPGYMTSPALATGQSPGLKAEFFEGAGAPPGLGSSVSGSWVVAQPPAGKNALGGENTTSPTGSTGKQVTPPAANGNGNAEGAPASLGTNLPSDIAGLGTRIVSAASTVLTESVWPSNTAATTTTTTTSSDSSTTTTTTAPTPAQQQQQPTAKPSGEHSHSHHAHPGPIALPSPPLHGFHPMGPISPLTGGLPPITPSMPPFTFVPQAATPPLSAHFLSPGVVPTPFSPPMSPGAFYHPPGAPPRYVAWNVAPGAPWHGHGHGSPMGSPVHGVYAPYPQPPPQHQQGEHAQQQHQGQGQGGGQGGGMDYFSVPPPPVRVQVEGYFPPVPASVMRSSGLANEIKRDSSNGSENTSGGVSPEGTTSGGKGGRQGSLSTASGPSEVSSSLEEVGSGAIPPRASAKDAGLEDTMARLVLSDQMRPKPLGADPLASHGVGVAGPPHGPQRTVSEGTTPPNGVHGAGASEQFGTRPRPAVTRDAVSTSEMLGTLGRVQGSV